jgi:hypothetical protein
MWNKVNGWLQEMQGKAQATGGNDSVINVKEEENISSIFN